MDSRLLRAFVTLADQGSYHAAAQSLYLTQPALTKQIQSIEQLLGLSLFQRGRHGAKLTELGKQLYPGACELLKQHDAFLEYAVEIQKVKVNKLAIGFGISSFKIAPSSVNIFREQFPEAEVSLNNIPSSIQCHMLLDGKLQVGFIRLPAPLSLEATVLMEETLILAVPSHIQTDDLRIQTILENYPLLQLNPENSPCLAEQVENFLRDNQLIARTISATDDIHSLLALIAAGNGVALLPASVRYFLPSGVKLIQPQGKHLEWQIGIAWNPKISNVLRDKFLQIVLRHDQTL
jgi:DNA-binding transcriptional LysR family regulator